MKAKNKKIVKWVLFGIASLAQVGTGFLLLDKDSSTNKKRVSLANQTSKKLMNLKLKKDFYNVDISNFDVKQANLIEDLITITELDKEGF